MKKLEVKNIARLSLLRKIINYQINLKNQILYRKFSIRLNNTDRWQKICSILYDGSVLDAPTLHIYFYTYLFLKYTVAIKQRERNTNITERE
jgi:hypothetical protein